MSGFAVGGTPKISLVAVLAGAVIIPFMCSQSETKYNHRMALYEQACDAEHPTQFGEAERRWRAALKTDMDDLRCDPLSVANNSPFGAFDAICESHLARVLCSRAVYYQTPLSTEVERLYQHALRTWQSNLGCDHKGTPRIQHQLAASWVLQGRYREAEVQFKEALEAKVHEFGEGGYDTVGTRDKLEALYEFDKHYSDAEALLNEDLRLSKQAYSYCSREWTLSKLACLYYDEERYEDALPLLEECLSKGALHTEGMHYLGLTYSHLGRGAEAEAIFKKSLRLNEDDCDCDPDFAASTMTDLALLYISQKRYADAEPLLTSALHVYKLVIDEDPSVIVLKERLRNIDLSSQALAKLYFLQGRDANAQSVLNAVGALMSCHRFDTLRNFDKLCKLERALFEDVGYPKEWIVQTTRQIPKGSMIRASDLEKIEVLPSFRACTHLLRSPLPAVGRRTRHDIADGAAVCADDIQWEQRSACTDSGVERELKIARQKWTSGQDALAEERHNQVNH